MSVVQSNAQVTGSIPASEISETVLPVSPLTRNMNRPLRKSDRPARRVPAMTHEQFQAYRRLDREFAEGDRAQTPPRPSVNK